MENRPSSSLDTHQRGISFSLKMVNKLCNRQCNPCERRARRELKPHDYERHMWQKRKDPSPWYLFYRWFQFASFAVICIYSIINGNKYAETGSTRWKWFIYLTNWGYSLCTIQSFMAMIIVQLALINKTHTNDGRTVVPPWYRVYHSFYTVALVTASTVTFMYWVTVFNPAKHKLDAINIMVHAGNSLAMYIDFLFVNLPWRINLIWWPICCGVLYSIFSFAYYISGGTDRDGNPFVYAILDWRNPLKAVGACFLCLTIQIAFHFTIYFLYKLRKKYIKCKEDTNALSDPLTLQEKPILVTVMS
ncbi:protein rolling stone-like [Arctopsyche grandis]|uniref:protein rolling stone-like n=1 Tax=Arctopsyche grandis TaxID=121162 RepID=UPI00406D894A